MSRPILIAVLALLIIPTNALANGSPIQSIQDICYDAPEWLVQLDKQEPSWLTKNLVNSTVNEWEKADYTEKIATLVVYLISHEYEKESLKSNENLDRDSGYRCTGIVEILDQEIEKHYLPKDFSVWECVHQLIELNNLTAKNSI